MKTQLLELDFPRDNGSTLYLLDNVFAEQGEANIIPIMSIKLGYKRMEELPCKSGKLRRQVKNCLDSLIGNVQ